MSDQFAIDVAGVTKKFILPRHKEDSIKSAITQMFKKKDKRADEFTVLNDITFQVDKGDFFGVVGRNGSGKSTLLKIISGIYTPTKGSVEHRGKVVAFIELGVGFKPNLTGRENVYLNGALLGFSKKEIDEIYDEIVEFAELEEFMEQKLKNYSSGMQVRLAFSVAIRASADILILDEVLAVGDAAFQRKCNDYFEKIRNEGKTVILVTHNMANVTRFCNKALLLEKGRIKAIGSSDEIAKEYTELLRDTKPPKTGERIEQVKGEYVEFISPAITQGGVETSEIEAFKGFAITVPVEIIKESEQAERFNVGITIKNRHNVTVFATDYSNINEKVFIDVRTRKKFNVKFTVEDNILTNGKYTVDVYYAYYTEDQKRVAADKYIAANTFTISGVKVHQESVAHLSTQAYLVQ